MLLICELCSCTMASSACSTSAATSSDWPPASSSATLTELAERLWRSWLLTPPDAPNTSRTCTTLRVLLTFDALLTHVHVMRSARHPHQRTQIFCIQRSLYSFYDVCWCDGRTWAGVPVRHASRTTARLHRQWSRSARGLGGEVQVLTWRTTMSALLTGQLGVGTAGKTNLLFPGNRQMPTA